MLIVAFGPNDVARQLCIAPKLHVFLGDRLRCTAQFDVRTIAVIDAVCGIAPAIIASTTAPATATTMTAAIAATAAILVIVIVLSGSH